MIQTKIELFKESLIKNCQILLVAYKKGMLGQTVMPEDSNPGFSEKYIENRLSYFTLPMALNYQRNSYDLWKAALKTYNDPITRQVFEIEKAISLEKDQLRDYLLKYKLALQPNKHIDTWQKISKTVYENWGSFSKLLDDTNNDFIRLKETVQRGYKAGFPYLSGPKIFNYWSFIINQYCNANLKNSNLIEIAPDTHITKCSIILGVITKKEAEMLSKEEISERWRILLKNSGIDPIDMHPPLWFWSRNGFLFKLPK